MESNHILLVDDDKDDRFLFSKAAKLADKQIVCQTAEHGLHALDLLRSNNPLPQVIFLDINMAEMNGWQCLTELKKDKTLKNIPVVMYSTSGHERDINLAEELGAICYCKKPDSLEDLEKIIGFVHKNLGTNLKASLENMSERKNISKHLTCF